MKITLLFCAIAGCSIMPASAEKLSGEALHKAVTGRTVYVMTPIGSELPVRYKAGGAMTAVTSAQLASLAGEDVRTDIGRWWVSGDRLCQKWQHWLSGKTSCYSFNVNGSAVRWTRSDGETGTARISR